MLGNVPFAAGYGTGSHTPAAFAMATVVLLIFCIGYATMATRVSSVGGFYSFISQGIGREVGMSAGIASLACYSIFEASLYGLFAYFGNQWIMTHLGINVGWIWLALAAVVGAGVLSVRDVKLSAAVLGLALILETLMLTIFAFGVFFAPKGTNFTAEIAERPARNHTGCRAEGGYCCYSCRGRRCWYFHGLLVMGRV